MKPAPMSGTTQNHTNVGFLYHTSKPGTPRTTSIIFSMLGFTF
jgi:hypothetical protein